MNRKYDIKITNKHSEGLDVFCLTGKIEVSSVHRESKELDGEIYWRDIIKSNVYDIEKLPTYQYCYNFKMIEYECVLNVPVLFLMNTDARRFFDINYSNNDEVNTILNLFDLGLLDNRIKKLYISKNDEVIDYRMGANSRTIEQYNNAVLKNELSFGLIHYGFNNSLYYSISLEDFIHIPREKLPTHVVDFFKEVGLFKNDDIISVALKLLETKTRLLKQQKQYYEYR